MADSHECNPEKAKSEESEEHYGEKNEKEINTFYTCRKMSGRRFQSTSEHYM